ncbi:MAG: hypothetical protein PWQ18_1448 [Clostridia bacterium]|nr:hypothetical protein [Clostridia bacterium]
MKPEQRISLDGWGLLLSALAAAALGAEGIAAKLAYVGGASILTTLALRFLLASLLFWASIAIFPLQWRLDRPTLARVVILALGGQATTVLLLFYAFQRIPAAVAILFFYIYPAVVTLLAAIFLREPLTRARVGALALTLIGLLVILGFPVGYLDTKGIAAALLAALGNGVYLIGQTSLLKRLEPRTFNTWATTALAPAFFLLALATGNLNLAFTFQALLAILILALVCTVLAYTAMAWGLRYIGASRAAIISTLEPAITALLGFLVLGERLHPYQFVGGALILVGVTWQQISGAKSGTPEDSYGIIKQ